MTCFYYDNKSTWGIKTIYNKRDICCINMVLLSSIIELKLLFEQSHIHITIPPQKTQNVLISWFLLFFDKLYKKVRGLADILMDADVQYTSIVLLHFYKLFFIIIWGPKEKFEGSEWRLKGYKIDSGNQSNLMEEEICLQRLFKKFFFRTVS